MSSMKRLFDKGRNLKFYQLYLPTTPHRCLSSTDIENDHQQPKELQRDSNLRLEFRV